MMKRILTALVLSISLLTLSGVSASAQDYQKGLAADNRGDYATAFKEWRPLAERGNAWAQTGLGSLYQHGKGVPQDYAEAVKWYRKAAEQGNASAQSNLAFAYGEGEGVLQDNLAAHMWSNIAAANGDDRGRQIRDIIAKKLSPADLTKAQQMAKRCMASDDTDC